MKKIICLLIIIMSTTMIFAQGKPCCKNKESKSKIACKFNKANIETNQEINVADNNIQITTASQRCTVDSKCTSINDKGCSKAPWWKFWGKKKGCCNTST